MNAATIDNVSVSIPKDWTARVIDSEYSGMSSSMREKRAIHLESLSKNSRSVTIEPDVVPIYKEWYGDLGLEGYKNALIALPDDVVVNNISIGAYSGFAYWAVDSNAVNPTVIVIPYGTKALTIAINNTPRLSFNQVEAEPDLHLVVSSLTLS